MKARTFTYTVLRSVKDQVVLTALLATVSAALAASMLLVLGRADAAMSDLITLLDSTSSRTFEFVDTDGTTQIDSNVVAQVEGLSNVEGVLAAGVPFDSTPVHVRGSDIKVPTWFVDGNLAYFVVLQQGRWPEVGEAIVSAEAQAGLNFDGPSGALASSTYDEFPVVGVYSTVVEVGGVGNAGALVLAKPGSNFRSVGLVASSLDVDSTLTSVIAVLHPQSLSSLEVSSPQTIGQLREDLLGTTASNSRYIVLGALAAFIVLEALVVTGHTLMRRVSIGRQRALGASRSLVTTLIAGHVCVASTGGAVIATILVGTAMGLRGSGVSFEFMISVIGLAVSASVIASLLPAGLAANRDPLLVLRSP